MRLALWLLGLALLGSGVALGADPAPPSADPSGGLAQLLATPGTGLVVILWLSNALREARKEIAELREAVAELRQLVTGDMASRRTPDT